MPLMALMVILAGTAGSFIGSALSYWLARVIGRPLIIRYGKYFFVPEKKFHLAEKWVGRYGSGGIFVARLIPVVRHVISIPAGLVGMRFRNFALMTLAGSALWCTVFTIVGLFMAPDLQTVMQANLAEEPEKIQQAMGNLTWVTVGMGLAIVVAYLLLMKWQKSRRQPDEAPAEAAVDASGG